MRKGPEGSGERVASSHAHWLEDDEREKKWTTRRSQRRQGRARSSELSKKFGFNRNANSLGEYFKKPFLVVCEGRIVRERMDQQEDHSWH